MIVIVEFWSVGEQIATSSSSSGPRPSDSVVPWAYAPQQEASAQTAYHSCQNGYENAHADAPGHESESEHEHVHAHEHWGSYAYEYAGSAVSEPAADSASHLASRLS